ncbi:sugar ABC transporter permease [Ktedonosporobacter rubrisoli]|uniref:Sugar ABC transporter permease n=1 Tax=Ktedonosporobacter rubrisoli TaxID=2509675 RepID=A0A4V0YYV2_KTERU|nr:sugar ABC transporter permease [Ktedonosporobacter rubrisoli]QBD77511.1 sugar ABC transporter permease [Ktedonosporobacter rubrisoli]
MGSISPVTAVSDSKTQSQTTASKSQVRKYIPLYLSIAPYYIVFLVFGLFPVLYSLYLAFQKWDGIGTMTFVGGSNFYLVLTDPLFGKAVLNTFEIWIMSTVPMLFLALVIAFLINQRSRSKFAYQLCFYLPNITSVVAVTLIFQALFGVQYGLVNQLLAALHLPTVAWLTDPWGIKWTISFMSIWLWTGYNALIYMAGLQSIPSEYYEAARTDGANIWHIFFHITLPMLRPIILFTVISSTIGGLSLFTEPQVLFSQVSNMLNTGGPGNAGLTMVLYQYWQGFANFHYGYGAAVGWIIFFILLICTAINWKLVQRGE